MRMRQLVGVAVKAPFACVTVAAAATLLCLIPEPGTGQWRNRYPRVQGYGHHVYLEGYELPVLTNGPIDPALSPDGRFLAFSARGWIWIMDLRSRTARQLTRGRDLDSRPAWHPSGNRLAIVRDDDHDTGIVVVSAESGDVLRTIDSPALDLDPAYSRDGRTLFHVSGKAGSLDILALDLETGEEVAVTSEPGIEMRPQPMPGGGEVMFLAKRGGDRVELRSLGGGEPRVLVSGSILSMARPAASANGADFVLGHPTGNGWDLRVHGLRRPGPSVTLTRDGLPLTPAWSPDGRHIYFAEPDDREVMRLKRVPAVGGPVESVEVAVWQWRDATARLRIRTRMAARNVAGPTTRVPPGEAAPARLSVVDGTGHPAIPDHGAPHFDGANGRVFFYSPGVVEVTVPAGEVAVSAVQGLATPEVRTTVTAAAGEVTEVELRLDPVWDARAAGWASGDHHFHLNYGGQYDLDPADMVPRMAGEALDMATPLLANLHNRYEDLDMWGWEKSDAPPFIRFGQEIRSHFLGHVGLIEIPEPYWPWAWGPGYEVYGSDDRTNAEVLEYAHGHGGLGFYVHPVSSADPFSAAGWGSVPASLVADAVLGDVDALEIMCLWSSSEGTAAVWHRLLNLGVTIAPSAGTDVMLNLYRTMAVGTTRVYAHTGAALNWPVYLAALRDGRSFVTNGPFLDFKVDGTRPGGVVGAGRAAWSLEAATATAFDTVDILVNGRVAASRPGIASPGRRTYSGDIELPAGGWIAARARGGETRWPSMDASPFAHTAPVWIGVRGSVDPVARREAARELLEVLTAARVRLRVGYSGTRIPRLEARFEEALAHLEALAAPDGEGPP